MNETTEALGLLLLHEWNRICGHNVTWAERDDRWRELLLDHDGTEIDPQTENPDTDTDKYLYPESPSWEGNVVRMPKETAAKLLLLGFR